SIDSVEISGEPWSLLRWGSGPVVFHALRPRCVFALGSTASPAPPPASPAAKPAEVGVPEQGPPAFPPGSRVKVRRGTLSLLAPGGIQFTCDGFGLDCGPGSQPHGFEGRAGCGGGVLTTPLGELRALEG